jgi:hypothetical protein
MATCSLWWKDSKVVIEAVSRGCFVHIGKGAKGCMYVKLEKGKGHFWWYKMTNKKNLAKYPAGAYKRLELEAVVYRPSYIPAPSSPGEPDNLSFLF